jgi:hypothetical protein
LARQRSFLFSGTKDTTVNPAVMSVLNQYFDYYVTDSDQVVFKNDLVAAHTQPTDDPVSVVVVVVVVSSSNKKQKNRNVLLYFSLSSNHLPLLTPTKKKHTHIGE